MEPTVFTHSLFVQIFLTAVVGGAIACLLAIAWCARRSELRYLKFACVLACVPFALILVGVLNDKVVVTNNEIRDESHLSGLIPGAVSLSLDDVASIAGLWVACSEASAAPLQYWEVTHLDGRSEVIQLRHLWYVHEDEIAALIRESGVTFTDSVFVDRRDPRVSGARSC